jgi:hypothetical protein
MTSKKFIPMPNFPKNPSMRELFWESWRSVHATLTVR